MATLPASNPSNPVHEVLSTGELVEIICFSLFNILQQPQSRGSGSRSLRPLLSLALSCRWLSHFALQALWSEVLDVALLFRTLPGDCWEGELSPMNCRVSVVSPTHELENLKAEDCTRFSMYCNFLQKLEISLVSLIDVDTAFFGHLERIFGPQLPLRRLRHLVWADTPELPVHPFSTYFFVPSLKTVEFQVDDDEEDAAYGLVLPKLLKNCPELNALSFTDCEEDYQGPIVELSNVVLGWKYLTILEIPSITTEALAELAIKNHSETVLARLHIGKLNDIDWNAFERLVQPGTAFTTLKSLALCEISLPGALKLLKASHLSLETLMLNIKTILSGDDWESLFHAIRRAIDVDQIGCLGIFEIALQPWTMADERVKVPETIGSNHLSALLPLKNLKALSLRATHGFNIDDASIPSLAQGLPSLQSFYLSTTRLYTLWPPMLTIDGLAQLALHLPDLQTLTLPFDAYTARKLEPKIEEALLAAERKSLVRYLHVCQSPIQRSSFVSKMLGCMFPKLEILRCDLCHDERSDYTQRKWGEVAAMMGLRGNGLDLALNMLDIS